MKLLKPNWVTHDGKDIFSVDVHPDGSRFATGGHGEDSGGKIIIWNMGPIIDNNKENDENVPRILCQMDHHIACVNIVRWSNNGMFLASGSDDKLVMIWQYAHGNSYQNLENWKCAHTLRAHNGDVLDLAWSKNDDYLATCSIDNTIIIWNALKFPDIIHRINGHSTFVKGVAWDPVGSYLASQSEDKTLKIWKTSDWSLEKSIDEPFKQSTGTTHVLRLNWAPDGQLLIAAHAVNNGAPTAQVINRTDNWSHKIDFVGHRKAVMVVRFYPQLLRPFDSKDLNSKVVCLCALGSRDRSVSIWLTNAIRPLCVIQDLFDNPIMDISWCKHPNPGLLACSTDGTIAYMEFDFKEVGNPLNKSETEEFFMKNFNHDIKAAALAVHKLHSSSLEKPLSAAIKKETVNNNFIENFDALIAQEQKEQQKNNLISSNPFKSPILNETGNSLLSNRVNLLTENQKQIERKMADGRRRITPICVSKPGEYDAPRPFGSESIFEKSNVIKSIGFGNSSNQGSLSGENTNTLTNFSGIIEKPGSIIIEKRDEKNQVIEVSPVKSINYTKQQNNQINSNESAAVKNFSSNTQANEILNQISSEPQAQSIPKTSLNIQKNVFIQSNQPLIQPASLTSNIKSSQLKPSVSTSSLAKSSENASKSLNNNNQSNLINSASSNTISKQKGQSNTSNATLSRQNSTSNIQQIASNQAFDENVLKSPSSREKLYFNHKFLEPLKALKNNFSKIFKFDGKEYIIEVYNSISLLSNISNQNNLINNNNTNISNSNESGFEISLVRLNCDKKQKWQIYLYSKICELVSNKQFLAIVCEDSTLNFFKLQNGCQICTPIVLDSQTAVLNTAANYCMCLTVTGNLYTWQYGSSDYKANNLNLSNSSQSKDNSNYFNLKTIIYQIPCQFMLQNDNSFSKAYLTDNGIPIVTTVHKLTNLSRSYYYSLETRCWHLVPISDSSSQLLSSSASVFSNNFSSSGLDRSGPLQQAQAKNNSSKLIKIVESLNKVDSNRNNLFNKQDFTLVHLESQLNASLGLNSPKEYKFWLMTYCRYLVENDYEEKLTELCNTLLGPLYSINWEESILIYKKRDLLKEILPILAQNLNFQRMHSLYKQQLNLISNFNQKSSVLNRLVTSSHSISDRLDSLSSVNRPAIVSNKTPSIIENNSSNPNQNALNEIESQSMIVEENQTNQTGVKIASSSVNMTEIQNQKSENIIETTNEIRAEEEILAETSPSSSSNNNDNMFNLNSNSNQNNLVINEVESEQSNKTIDEKINENIQSVSEQMVAE